MRVPAFPFFKGSRVTELTLDAIRSIVREEMSRPKSPWLDGAAAAAYLGTTAGTLKTWRATSKGPRYRVLQDRLIRYHVDDLDAFARGE